MATDLESDGRVHNERGLALAQAGDLPQALAEFQRAAQLAPAMAEAHHNAGLALLMLGRASDAEQSLRQAIRLAPELADAHLRLAGALEAQGKLKETIEFLNAALAQPEFASNLALANELAATLYRAGDAEQSAKLLASIVRSHPEHPVPRENFARTLAALGRTQEADEQYDVIISFRRASSATLIRRATLLPVIPASLDEMLAWRRRSEQRLDELLQTDLRVADPVAEVAGNNFQLAYHGLDDRAIQEKLAKVYLNGCPSLAWTAPHCQRPRDASRHHIRIGFISTHFYNHTIGKLNVGLIEKLDRRRFEVALFHLGKQDALARRLASASDIATNVSAAQPLPALREAIARHELDILFYTDIGMAPLTYFLAFARLARVQCTTWGHPITTGIPTIDHFISSQHLEPAGSEQQYSERLVKLPSVNTHYFRPPAPHDVSRKRFGFADDWRLYVCAQSLFKLHPDFDVALGQILRRDPQGRLILIEPKHPSWAILLRDRFKRMMPDVVDRVLFVPPQPEEGFLALLAIADANLDTFHFGGGNTSLEAFAAGAPVVTLPSQFLRGRITYALYRQMGIDALIARDADDYVQLALRLASDRSWREELSSQIHAASAKIFENNNVIGEFEQFFESEMDEARG
jgi:predicted O-linked N-acetylglucosamine transferase (SPINDLY family)